MDKYNRGFIPMGSGITLSKSQSPIGLEDVERMKSIPYASDVGSIIYAMICTRPDVSNALSMTSRYQANPGKIHWIAVKNILKDDMKSQAGFVFMINGGAVSWRSFKESVVADCTTEAEFIATSEAVKEALWIRQFLEGLGVVSSAQDPITLYCDNSGAIFKAKEPKSSNKSRHVKHDQHVVSSGLKRMPNLY
ncbi:secreted RxLR effector protein 161-like [Silene latifolia]|uniref:secreted RxLR effector protein 161-like n=1 Tax=Silene latifolia TaxID=37657 RepID=UPI003D770653